MPKFYFTFGYGQPYEGGYHVIEAENQYVARERMIERFGKTWAFQYDEENWTQDGITQEEKYNLFEVN